MLSGVTFLGPRAEAHFGAYARTFAAQFGTGRACDEASVAQGMTGRVLRGIGAGDFATLSDDPRRRIVFLLDADALRDLIGLTGWDVLLHIGYDAAFIQRLLAKGTRFRLALLPEVAMLPGTWDHLLDLVQTEYPEWRAGVTEARAVLKTLHYDQVMASAGLPAGLRAFLRNVINVNRLYAGDGYTRREGVPDQRVYAEYVCRNRPLAEFDAACLIEFPVVEP